MSKTVGAVYDRAFSPNQQNTRGHRPRLQLKILQIIFINDVFQRLLGGHMFEHTKN